MAAGITLGLAVIGSLAIGGPAHAEGGGVTHRVACGTDAPDTLGSLDEVNALRLAPGDAVLFQRGTTCTGTLAPRGSGTAEQRIRIGAYGEGARPVIDGAGATDTVLLRNVSGYELSGLEITNSADPGSKRRGVFVLGEDAGVLADLTIRDLYVHDVWGDDTKDTDGSGGIIVAAAGRSTPTSFRNVVVADNIVRDVDRSGIVVGTSLWGDRPESGKPDVVLPWTPSSDVLIKGNDVANTGGDGILISTTKRGRVEDNRVDGFQERSAGYNAGIWPWNSEDIVFTGNEASGGRTTRDGMAFDIDQGTNNVTFEYNYSHDNEGGFFLLCNAAGSIRNAVVRYNVSVNDSHRGIETCSGTIDSAQIYNNTIYIGDGVSQTVINENNANTRNVRFANNLVLKEGSGTANFRLASPAGYRLDHNLIRNVGNLPPNPGGSTADPMLVAPGSGGSSIDDLDGYRLRTGSPAYRAGAVLDDNGGRDFFGARLRGDVPPSIGADDAGNCTAPSSPGRPFPCRGTGVVGRG